MTGERGRRGKARLGFASLAAGGVMAGHWVAYAVREPDAGARAVLLEATGHHLLPQLSLVSAFAALVALVAVPRSGGGAGLSYGRAARTLVALQMGGFLALEVGERLLAHSHGLGLHHLADPALAIGLAAQVLIGGAAAALLVGLCRLAARVPGTAPASHVPFLAPGRPGPSARVDRPGDGTCPPRGPPVLSRA